MNPMVVNERRQAIHWEELLQEVAALTELPWDRQAVSSGYPHVLNYVQLSFALPQLFDEFIMHGAHTPHSVFVAALHLLLYQYGNKGGVATASIRADKIVDISRSQCGDMGLSEFVRCMQHVEVRELQFGTVITAEELRSRLIRHDAVDKANLLPVLIADGDQPVDARMIELLKPALIFYFHHVNEVASGSVLAVKVGFSRQFETATIERMLSHYQSLLTLAINTPNDRMNCAAWLPDSERLTVIESWNQTQREYDHTACIHELFERQVLQHPDAIAVSDSSQSLTYLELNRHANRLARQLIVSGVLPDNLIGICIPRSVEMIAGVLAILKAGAAYVALDPEYPAERLKYMLHDAQLRYVLTVEDTAGLINIIKSDTICINANVLSGDHQNIAAAVVGVSSNHLAYAIYTSGSTGHPKASLLTHRGLCNMAAAQKEIFGANESSKVLQFASLSFDAATFEWVMALCNGAQLCMLSEQVAKTPDALSQFVLMEHITHATLPPVLLQHLDRDSWRSVTTMIVAGEACSKSTAERWSKGRRFFNAYGPSEMTVWSTVGLITPEQYIVDIGTPIQNTCCYVLDESRQPVPIGIAGELYVAGAGISRKYLNQPEANQIKFVSNPFSPSLYPMMFRTGDRVRWLSNGKLEFLGRVDRQIKLRGFRVELEEVEHVLRSHEGVADAVVEVQRQGERAQALVAYVIPSIEFYKMNTTALTRASVSQWQALFDESYKHIDLVNGTDHTDSELFSNFSGWNSSYTLQAIPRDAMEDWRRATIERITNLQPKKVLEVGCGAGLLMSRLVREVQSYVGVDLSAEVIGKLRNSLGVLGDEAHKIELYACSADQLPQYLHDKFDTIIVNSVVQCFPDVTYLDQVLSSLASLLEDSGTLFIGDVRNSEWNDAFHASIEAFQNRTYIDRDDFIGCVQSRLNNDKELVISPEYFLHYAKQSRSFAAVEVMPKLGFIENEMNRFRYDVVMHRALSVRTLEIAHIDWDAVGSLEAVKNVCAQHISRNADAAVIIRDIPYSRTAAEVELWRQCKAATGKQWVGVAAERLAAISHRVLNDAAGLGDPVQWLPLTDQLNCRIRFSVSMNERPVFHVALFNGALSSTLIDSLQLGAKTSARINVNNPLSRSAGEQLQRELKRHLATLLPQYMQPASITVLERFPLTANGKVDRKALLVPDMRDVSRSYVAPASSCEKQLCEIWENSLGISKIGVHDNFYHVGGDSLRAGHIIAQMRKHFAPLEFDIAIIQRFQTVAELAPFIELRMTQLHAVSTNAAIDRQTTEREVLRI